MFDLEEVKARAEAASYQRGVKLFQLGQISRLTINGDTAKATVLGQHAYQVALTQGTPIHNHCTCPAAEYQDFCKHCVAVALMVESDDVMHSDTPDFADQLHDHLVQKPVNELVDLLVGYIENDEHEWKKWQGKLATSKGDVSLGELKKLVTKALPSESVWDWYEVQAYFDDAETLFESIFDAYAQLSINDQWALIIRAIERLNKVLERIDDSGGFRFEIEGQLNQKLVDVFELLEWPPHQKAQWLFEHLQGAGFDIFPAVPEDFTLTAEVEQPFLALCRDHLEASVADGDMSEFDQRWQALRFARPLIKQAQQTGDWRAHCRLLAMTAHDYQDYLRISQLCLDHQEELDAEDWLIRAKKQCSTDYEKRECQKHEVSVRIAVGEPEAAWKMAWQLFSDKPSFDGYKQLQTLHQQIGEPEPDFITKVESVLAGCYQEPAAGRANHNFDAVLDFYLDQQQLDKAREWAKTHKANRDTLIQLANLIVAEYPKESLALYHRTLKIVISQTNNSAYQEAIALLLQLEKSMLANAHDRVMLDNMVTELAKEFKPKRNMMKLLREHFAHCL